MVLIKHRGVIGSQIFSKWAQAGGAQKKLILRVKGGLAETLVCFKCMFPILEYAGAM